MDTIKLQFVFVFYVCLCSLFDCILCVCVCVLYLRCRSAIIVELTVLFDFPPAGEGNKVATFALWGTLSKFCNIVLIIHDRGNE